MDGMTIWPSESILRRAGYVVVVMKSLAVFLVVGGTFAAIIEAASSSSGDSTAVRVAAISTFLGGIVFGSLWAWLGYVLEALMGIWLSTSDGIEEASE